MTEPRWLKSFRKRELRHRTWCLDQLMQSGYAVQMVETDHGGIELPGHWVIHHDGWEYYRGDRADGKKEHGRSLMAVIDAMTDDWELFADRRVAALHQVLAGMRSQAVTR